MYLLLTCFNTFEVILYSPPLPTPDSHFLCPILHLFFLPWLIIDSEPVKTSLLGFQCDCFCSQWTSGWGSQEGKVALWAREVIINTFLLRPSYRASVENFNQEQRTSYCVSVHLHLTHNMHSLPFSEQLASPSHSISCRGAGRQLCCLWGMTWDRQAGVIRKAQAQTWSGRKKISLTAHKQDITVWHFCTENIISTNGISGARYMFV